MPAATESMLSSIVWAAPLLAAILVLVVVVVYVRRRRDGASETSSVFPPSRSEGGFQVRLLEDREVAHDARITALRGEVQALRREATYAAQRGLDRRAERLEALIVEREQELARHESTDVDRGHERDQGR